MNAAATNLGIIPAAATDRTPRSSSVSAKQDSNGPMSFADSLQSARSSDAHTASAPKATSTKTSAPEVTKTSASAASATTSATPSKTSSDVPVGTNPSADETATSVQTAPASAQIPTQTVDPSQQVNPDVAVQQAAIKAQLKDKNDASGDAADLKDQPAEDADKTVATNAHPSDAKPAKKHTSSAAGSAVTEKNATVAAQPTAMQTVPAVPVVASAPAAATNPDAKSKASATSVAITSRTTKATSATTAAPLTNTPAVEANATAPAAINVQENAEDTEVSASGSSFADKIIAAAGPQHAVSLHDGVDSFQQGATFSYSLHNAANLHTGASDGTKATVDTKALASADDVNPAAAFTPVVRRLEVAVNDPVLGNVDVRAEMRGGVLHASIGSTQTNVAATAAELHQFLQQNQVAVHTVSFHNTADAIRPTQQGAASSFSNSDSGSRENAQYSGSSAQQQNREGASDRRSYMNSYGNDSVYGSTFNRPASSAVPAAMLTPQTSGGNLSIHI